MTTSEQKSWRHKRLSVLTLFTSAGTLLCCALPAALGALAGGAATLALTDALPWIIPLSRHKEWIFLAASILVTLNGILVFRPGGRMVCAISDGEGCEVAGRFTKIAFYISAGMVGVGLLFAYILPWMMGVL